jgi:malate dehydrogenase (oxaloacetate-decarboxylating)(NADP+)
MANPVPEIDYHLAKLRGPILLWLLEIRLSNQVNNVLGFLYISWCIRCSCHKNNEAMKMAAVRALAALAKEYVPEQVNIAYGATKLILDVILYLLHLIQD